MAAPYFPESGLIACGLAQTLTSVRAKPQAMKGTELERIRTPDLRALLQRRVRHVVLADVDLLGSEDPVVLELLQPVGQPASDSGDGEDRREQVARNAERLIHDTRVVIDVGVNTLRPVDAGGDALQ